MTKPVTVEDYLDRFDEPAHSMLTRLRTIAGQAAPNTHIELKWGSPAWIHASGTILFVVDGFKHHANVVFTPSTREAFDAELVKFKTGKGSVKIAYSDPVPVELLAGMIAYRIREHEDDGVLWM